MKATKATKRTGANKVTEKSLKGAKPKNNLSELTEEERIDMVENIFIQHPQLKRIVDKIGECHQESKRSIEPQCLFITGMPGCGKTTIARHYESLYPRIVSKEGTDIPVLSSTVFAPATAKNIATGLLYSLDYLYP